MKAKHKYYKKGIKMTKAHKNTKIKMKSEIKYWMKN